MGRIAILWPGDRESRQKATLEGNRFGTVAESIREQGIAVEPAVYADDFVDEVRQQLLQVDGVLVWVNPIEKGKDRSILDAMLREVAEAGVFVSAHPDVILKMGTKEVLYDTRTVGWGTDTHLYRTMAELKECLPVRLAQGQARVLKQYRGNGGSGVWKVEWEGSNPAGAAVPTPETRVKVRHAQRGCIEEEISLAEFYRCCEPYFAGPGRIIDQAYQVRLPEGIIRCYLVHDKVAGFGHQEINALFPAPPGAPPQEAPRPGPRLYFPPTRPDFQSLKRKLEDEWVPSMQALLDIDTASLPVLWDADFFLGLKDAAGNDTYVLCEINVSSVYPFPDDALPHLARAALKGIQSANAHAVKSA